MHSLEVIKVRNARAAGREYSAMIEDGDWRVANVAKREQERAERREVAAHIAHKIEDKPVQGVNAASGADSLLRAFWAGTRDA